MAERATNVGQRRRYPLDALNAKTQTESHAEG